MKFLVFPPVALVPFQFAEICSAFGSARAARPLRETDLEKDLTFGKERRVAEVRDIGGIVGRG
jgi:hypothetical protein